ncbi:MAG: hypothetical protein LBS18_02535 [Clostridiales bacterium]|jgi:hypothetical protein|nr:hypothetical protein [Clostridiales bacterium]
MKRNHLALALCAVCLLTSCVSQAPSLVGTPTPRITPTPVPTPTPDLVDLPDVDTDTDALGVKIDGDAHFLQYLTFQSIRVYEYGGDTFLDGLCNNAYPETLYGAFEVCFTDTDGVELARAPIHIRGEEGALPSGDTVLYAQIDVDTDIQLVPFEIIVVQRVWPQMRMIVSE